MRHLQFADRDAQGANAVTDGSVAGHCVDDRGDSGAVEVGENAGQHRLCAARVEASDDLADDHCHAVWPAIGAGSHEAAGATLRCRSDATIELIRAIAIRI